MLEDESKNGQINHQMLFYWIFKWNEHDK